MQYNENVQNIFTFINNGHTIHLIIIKKVLIKINKSDCFKSMYVCIYIYTCTKTSNKRNFRTIILQ